MKNQTSENRGGFIGKAVRKLYMSGRSSRNFLAVLKKENILGNIFVALNRYFTEISRWVPLLSKEKKPRQNKSNLKKPTKQNRMIQLVLVRATVSWLSKHRSMQSTVFPQLFKRLLSGFVVYEM